MFAPGFVWPLGVLKRQPLSTEQLPQRVCLVQTLYLPAKESSHDWKRSCQFQVDH